VPAPSVLVFNQAGDVIKSWRGPSDNLGYDWPLQEHASLVDNKGFVWLSGNGKGDSMVLKFTTDGKFDSRGNFYTGEVDTGKRLQKWVPVE
jgi:hypothetical protein